MIFVTITVMLLVTAIFVAAVVSASVIEKRRSQAHLEQIEAKLDRMVEANMSPQERARDLDRRKRIVASNLRAFALYGG